MNDGIYFLIFAVIVLGLLGVAARMIEGPSREKRKEDSK